MKPPRLTLVGSMGLVVLLAANLAAARVLYAHNSEMLVGVAFGAIILQYALFRLIRNDRRRAFWAGFLAGGLVAIAGFAWAMTFPEVMGISLDPGGSMTVHTTPGSPLYAIWQGYASLVGDRIVMPAFAALDIHPNPETTSGGVLMATLRAVIWGLPQITAAAAGGLLGLAIAAMCARYTSGGGTGNAPIARTPSSDSSQTSVEIG